MHVVPTGRGSSPRMRGTLVVCHFLCSLLGIIPAYAGNTASRACSSGTERDHPRVCGEHPEIRLLHGARLGSSPRMRGTPFAPYPADRQRGIIPAYAGNTHVELRTYSSCRDHPRVCGEHQSAPTKTVQRKGSSPRMRGTPNGVEYRIADTGIIPAYAGNTPVACRRDGRNRDHPRVCGEHLCESTFTASSKGSSPRMRGTLKRTRIAVDVTGIIPAYAGNT